jgi:anti-sigma B factor antagonist
MAELEERHKLESARVAVWHEGGTPVIKLSGDLDLLSEEPVRAALDTALADEHTRVIFDLSSLHFMDSSGIALLLGVARKVPDVELRNPTAAVRRLIELTGLGEKVLILR